MPASLAQLKFSNGVPSLHCPATGRLVCSSARGTDTEAMHSPHLRFFVDWDGNPYAVMPEALPPEQAANQRELLLVLGAAFDAYENDRARIAACCAVMPATALVLEVHDAPDGTQTGDVTYYGFDLAALPAGAGVTEVRIRAIPREPAGGAPSITFEPEPDPRVAPFGYFASDQFGVGAFRWSNTAQEALARYVHEDLLGGLIEDEDTTDRVSALYEGWSETGVGLGDVVAQLNKVTGDESTVVWWGTFDELTRGEGEFVREVREAWRESRGGCSSPVILGTTETIDSPVPAEALDEFVGFVATFGY